MNTEMDCCGSGCCSIVVGDNDDGNLVKMMRRLLSCLFVAAAVVDVAVDVVVDCHNIQ